MVTVLQQGLQASCLSGGEEGLRQAPFPISMGSAVSSSGKIGYSGVLEELGGRSWPGGVVGWEDCFVWVWLILAWATAGGSAVCPCWKNSMHDTELLR